MAQCKECIHYEICELYKTLGTYIISKDCGFFTNKADVVPKSEVDNLKAEIERLRRYNNGIFDVLELAEYKISKLYNDYTESEDKV